MCSIDYDDYAELWIETWRHARKQHRCSGCKGTIAVGARYLVHFSKFDGDVSSAKLCAGCDEARSAFAAAHDHVTPFPGTLYETLEDCISDGDEESERLWKPMLAAMDTRRAAAEARS